MMISFQALKKAAKRQDEGLPTVQVALLADSASQFLGQALKGAVKSMGFQVELWEAEYDQISQQLEDPQSDFHQKKFDFVLLYPGVEKWEKKARKSQLAALSSQAETALNQMESWYHCIRNSSQAKVICTNFPERTDAVFGHYSNKVEGSLSYQLRKYNLGLMDLGQKHSDFFVLDLNIIQSRMGRSQFFPAGFHVNADLNISLEAIPQVAMECAQLMAAVRGKFKKCLILDLDNTTWGGVIGDDGLEHIQIGSLGIGKAFTELQLWAKQLKERGIILAVCSKNTESVAKEPFEKHPDMVLRLEDIAVFVANWENKADNIRHIQSVLNIGFDSMVFLDDNPFERNLVRQELPDVEVPELPEDPALYLSYLESFNYFETASFSETDKDRTQMYQVEAERKKVESKFTDVKDYLKNLEMTSVVEGFTPFNSPRVAQLTQRSNQFNLRTIRYTEDEIKAIEADEKRYGLSFTLEDRFGDNGLIAVIILDGRASDETLFIDTWLMSCRVLKRGMEQFVLNELVKFAKKNGYSKLKGEYIRSQKNEMVANHYESLGFEKSGEFWLLNLESFEAKETYINRK